jgi:hypothetical protein
MGWITLQIIHSANLNSVPSSQRSPHHALMEEGARAKWVPGASLVPDYIGQTPASHRLWQIPKEYMVEWLNQFMPDATLFLAKK